MTMAMVRDDYDAFPLDGSEVDDTDGDGVGNNADEDDDGAAFETMKTLFPIRRLMIRMGMVSAITLKDSQLGDFAER